MMDKPPGTVKAKILAGDRRLVTHLPPWFA